jgi:hypothetical protein
MIKRGDLQGRQLCRGAPWVIKAIVTWRRSRAPLGLGNRYQQNLRSTPLTFNNVER